MKRILITGNAGYIGSHLTKLLQDTYNRVSNQYRMYGLDTEPSQVSTDVQYSVDIRDRNLRIDNHFDCVVHLAALVNVSESERNPAAYYDTNLNGTINLLKNIVTDNFIMASTGAAEKCESAYGISKRAAEDCVREYCTKNNIDFTIFRFYNVIGSSGINPTNPDGLFYNLIKAMDTKKFTIYGTDCNTPDGTCLRDYVHVLEICNAIQLAIETPSNQLENLGHGKGHSVKEMVNLFKQVNNTDFDVVYDARRKGDIEISVLDNPSTYMKQLYSVADLIRVR